MNAVITQTLSPSVASLAPATALKVLFFYLDYGAFGGIEKTILQAAEGLRRRDSYVPVIVCSRDGELYRRAKARGLTVYGIDSHPRFARSIWRMLDVTAHRQLIDIIWLERPALVHVHIGLLENAWLRHVTVPMVYTVHGYGSLYSLEGSTGLKHWFKRAVRALFRKTTRAVDQLVFVSQAERERMRREGFLDETVSGVVLHNGVDVSHIQREAAHTDTAALKERLGIPADARCVLYVNRLDANKNPLDFLALARRLSVRTGLGPLAFVMAGDGPLMDTVRREAAALDQVYVLGHRNDVPALLQLADVVVHPATHEGFGLGLVEAMAVGVPVAAYASEGAGEVIGEDANGLVPVGDIAALTEAVERLLSMSGSERALLSRRLQDRAEVFEESAWLDGLERIYRQVTPMVSVILPVYNGEATVARAVRSVLSQDYPHLELLVVDDGSTDSTLTVLSDIADPRLRVLRQENAGVAAARNHGLSQARGDYMAFIDADDVWLPEKLSAELQVVSAVRRAQGLFENPVCMVYSGYYAVDRADRLIHLPPVYRYQGDVSTRVLEYEGMFLPSTTLVHRDIIQALGGFQSECYHEDRAFFIRACQTFPAYTTSRRLVLYRQTEDGRCRRILADSEAAIEAELSIVDAVSDTLDEAQCQRLRQLQVRNLAYRFLMYDQLSSARCLLALLPPELAYRGKKGLLARWSINSERNWLAMARRAVQFVFRATSPILLPERLPENPSDADL